MPFHDLYGRSRRACLRLRFTLFPKSRLRISRDIGQGSRIHWPYEANVPKGEVYGDDQSVEILQVWIIIASKY